MANSSNFHDCVNQIETLLKRNFYEYELLVHPPVRTSEEAAKIRPKEYSIEQGAKALIVRVKINSKQKYFCMLVVPGNRKFDVNKVKILLDAKDIRLATDKEIAQVTDNVLPGGVPPFGNLFGLKTYADKNIFDMKKIIFNAGDKRVSISISTEAYKNVVNPEVCDIT